MSLLETRSNYKPFLYPFAFDAYKKQSELHWLPHEIPMQNDVEDWKFKLTTEEKSLLTQIFRFFTTADVDVARGYSKYYLPMLSGNPEVAMMLNTFAAMEAIHVDAYSLLLDTIGMPEVEYQAFAKYKAMSDKHEYVNYLGSCSDAEDLAKKIAIYSGFGEGMQLFASFAILMNFPRFGKMKGMGQIITWSIRDESLHVEAMLKLFKTLVQENPRIWTDSLKKEIYEAAVKMVELEDSFIDLAFEQGEIQGLNKEDVKQYIRYIADRRLLQMGLKTNFKVKENPLLWLEEILNNQEHASFFEQRVTEYQKAAIIGDWNIQVWRKNANN